MSGWNFAAVWTRLARAVPDRAALICGDRVVTWAEFDDRAARLASWLSDHGARPGGTVAIDMTNRPEYLETFFAALKLGCAPVNVNYRYLVDETRHVLADSGAVAVVHAPEVADVVRQAAESADTAPARLETGEPYEAAIAGAPPAGGWTAREPDGDDLVVLYTGGTTGLPKGVMWRNDDLYLSLWELARPGTEPPDPVEAVLAGKRAGTILPASPLMHGTALWGAISTLAGGGTVVLIDRAGLDAELVWDEVERNRVQLLSIVGDVFARPLLDELDTRPDRWDLSKLRAVMSSGVTWSPEVKAGLLHHLPRVTLVDSLGASEGLMSRSASSAGDAIKPARFAVNDRVKVLDEVSGRPVTAGSDEIGVIAVTGHIPIGYLNDPEKTAQTFRVYDGVRYSIPGDYGSVDADGTIRLLGRGSACINTGGEKVYPEEVEIVLREHRGVADCVVVGVPDARFGERVVALVQPEAGTDLDEAELDSWCRARLAGYKKPRRFVMLDSLQRSAAGKADYRYLRDVAAQLASG
jgi:3-oxocholest-4-en-26-oate---CoA ligase